MNNTLCLAVFSALVFFRGLEWQFSAGTFFLIFILENIIAVFFSLLEVTVILFVEFTVGLIAIVTGFFYKHTYVVSLL